MLGEKRREGQESKLVAESLWAEVPGDQLSLSAHALSLKDRYSGIRNAPVLEADRWPGWAGSDSPGGLAARVNG